MKFKKLLAVCITAAMFLSVGSGASAATVSGSDTAVTVVNSLRGQVVTKTKFKSNGNQDYEYHYFGNHAYSIINRGMDWHDAKSYCEKIGGHLVTITSEEEELFIESLIKDNEKNNYWLGGFKDSSHNMKWITGEEFVYQNWGGNQPDHYSEDALMIYTYDNPVTGNNDTLTWNDLNADGTFGSESWFGIDNFGFICEWDKIPKKDGKITFHAMILNGIKGGLNESCDNDAAMMYTRSCDNELSNAIVKQTNIHPFSYDCDSDNTSVADVNKMIDHSFKDTDDDDISLFYYTGHSTWDGNSAENYGITLGNGFYKWSELSSYLSKKIRGTIVVIMDSCFSGYFITNGLTNLSETDRARFSVITSCSEEEESSVKAKNFILFDN